LAACGWRLEGRTGLGLLESYGSDQSEVRRGRGRGQCAGTYNKLVNNSRELMMAKVRATAPQMDEKAMLRQKEFGMSAGLFNLT
jgi:hypothetical protein